MRRDLLTRVIRRFLLLRFVPGQIIPPRVNFAEIDQMFPLLKDLFVVQDWIDFMSFNTIHYPSLVQKLYVNMFIENKNEDATVKGVKISLSEFFLGL